MPSVLGLVEEREAGARREVERLRGEAARLAAALGEAEAELSRLVIARETLRDVLRAEPGDRGSAVAIGPAGAGLEGGIRVAVPVREPGMGLTALPGIYRQLAQALEASPEPLQAGELTRLLGLEATASAVEGVRGKAKRLVVRGWAVQADRGRFMLAPVRAAAA
ncbi:hypothetical protein ABZW30_03550 [Kitasatospora sp. NPDC004669]|uniref:hypothetical protein n=1 Tax=Kitasatospora sp. NPDC004669 TaxID=3154555 RepID=UPI00339FB544